MARRIGRGILTSLTTIAAADADPAAGYYTNRSPEPTPDPTPVPDGVHAPAAIVLLTDGENNQSPGSARGGRRPPPTAASGSTRSASAARRGRRSRSRASRSTAGWTSRCSRQISEITDGAYYAADDPDELSAIYDSIDTRLVIRPEAMEVTSLFAGAGVLVLLVGGVASLAWLGRLP